MSYDTPSTDRRACLEGFLPPDMCEGVHSRNSMNAQEQADHKAPYHKTPSTAENLAQNK